MMHRREYQLRMALEPVLGDDHTVVLDLRRNLGQLVTSTALNAADSLVIPTDATKWGRPRRHDVPGMVRGPAQRAGHDRPELLALQYSQPRAMSPRPSSAARPAVRRTPRRRRDPAGSDAIIPKRVAAERMVNDRLVLGDADADADLSRAYAALTVEVMHHIQTAHTPEGGHHRG